VHELVDNERTNQTTAAKALNGWRRRRCRRAVTAEAFHPRKSLLDVLPVQAVPRERSAIKGAGSIAPSWVGPTLAHLGTITRTSSRQKSAFHAA
jgi:hypothetical protein